MLLLLRPLRTAAAGDLPKWAPAEPLGRRFVEAGLGASFLDLLRLTTPGVDAEPLPKALFVVRELLKLLLLDLDLATQLLLSASLVELFLRDVVVAHGHARIEGPLARQVP